MRSHLTRSVFRAILANEPCSHSQCQRQLLLSLPRRKVGRLFPSDIQTRTFFGLPNQLRPDAQSRQGRERSTDPGMMHMVNLSKALQQRSRPPSPAVLAKAFQDFITARLEYPGTLTDFHVRFLLGTFEHLQKEKDASDDAGKELNSVFDPETLEGVLFVLSEAECDPLSHGSVLQLAHLVFGELRGNEHVVLTAEVLEAYITLLSAVGAPGQGRVLVEKFWKQLSQETGLSCWMAVMKGYARQGVKEEVGKVIKRMSKYGVTWDPATHEEITLSMVKENRLEEAKMIYEGVRGNPKPTVATKLAAFRLALLSSDMGWAGHIFNTLPQEPSSETRDTILLWSAVRRQSVEKIGQQLEDMISRNPELKDTLTIGSINNLIEYSNRMNDPTNAEAYVSLARQWDLQPDAQTNLLLLQSRISAGNSNGIVESLRKLAEEDALDDIDLFLMNKLVLALTTNTRVEVERDLVLSLVDRLVERSVRLDPKTQEALCRMLLYNNDLDAASEILRPQLDSYNMEERTTIRDAFLGFILDPKPEDDTVWEAYELLRVAFPETGVKQRTAIMTAFFRRRRTDLACLVFGHMRQNEDFDRRPKPDTYARCFQGIARSADEDSLHLVHNMMKLDLEVELDTRIYNGLMLAYAACGFPEQSMTFFQDILHSDEGPSNNSIAIFLRICESHHNGTEEAMKMMEKLKSLEIYISRRVYTSYIGALAGQCEFELAAEAIRTMESQTSYSPTGFTIATFYNAIPYQYWKDQVADWAKTAFPELWSEAEGYGYIENEEDGSQNFNIDRDLHV